ncbi:hypothetical protein CPB84DRAFT_1841774 [Gymnopilus junonius]|uniref:F-box domain-containing protein n=1 Tax=Gymnopilus junonius TaxID=109634 RepID=A0A9P5TTW3_GYMJU|nr:hypothetical protein CPB84DRAFT_1841774 [Gymnopilus junonius]
MAARKSMRIAEQNGNRYAAAQLTRQASPKPERAMTDKPPRKKQKVALKAKPNSSAPVEDDFRKIRGRRGALKTMTEMPVDILLEIFSQLQPVDLLHISRATKALRAIVLEESSKFLWEQVYRNVPGPEKPPACPPGMSPLHYTNVLYGRYCQSCTSTPARVVHWHARVRLCSKCAPKQLVHTAKTGDIYLICSAMYFKSSPTMYAGSYVLKAQYERHARLYNAIQEEKDRAQYRKEAEKESKIRSNHGQKLQFWERKMKRARVGNTRSIRDGRRQAIIRMIYKEGYAQELSRCRVEDLPGVKVTKELTDKEWDKIKHKILPALEYLRQENKRRQLISSYNWRLRDLATKVESTTSKIMKPPVFPPISQYARTEPFRSLIKDDTISNSDLLRRLVEHESQIATIATSWKDNTDRFLRKLLQESSNIVGSDVDPLHLAVTFFKCGFCDDPITYPRILMHRCLRDRPYENEENENKEDTKEDSRSQEGDDEDEVDEEDNELSANDDMEEVAPVTPESVWADISSWYGSTWDEVNDQIFVDDEATGFAKAVVKVCGEDPDTLTFSAMEEKDTRLECVRCTAKAKQKTRNRLVMNWKMAILHDLEVHFDETTSEQNWKLLTDASDLAKVKESELKMSAKWKLPDCHCVHCQHRMPRNNVESHLSVFHREKRQEGRDGNWINDHIYPILDIPMKTPPYSVRI